MKDEKFIIRAYGKSELAMLYFPNSSANTALKQLKAWLRFNPRLCYIARTKSKLYTPKQVKTIVGELGEPFDIEEDR